MKTSRSMRGLAVEDVVNTCCYILHKRTILCLAYISPLREHNTTACIEFTTFALVGRAPTANAKCDLTCTHTGFLSPFHRLELLLIIHKPLAP